MRSVADYYQTLVQTTARAHAAALAGGRSIDAHMVDVACIQGATLFHGSFSNLNGPPAATWTFDENGKRVTRNEPIDKSTFESIWNGICDCAAFARSMATDKDAVINPKTHYVIGVSWLENGVPGMNVYLIPASEKDADFVRWLKVINIPTPNSKTS